MRLPHFISIAFALAGLLSPLAAHAQWQGGGNNGRFVCESGDGRYNECRVDTRQGVTMVRQVSRSACIEGQSWGIRRDAVWVDRGCRAEFALGGYGAGNYGGYGNYGYNNGRGWNSYGRTVVCESPRSRHNECPIDTRYGVTVVRQLSDTRCREGHNWGTRPSVVWVDHGCRAEFGPASNNRGYGNNYGYDNGRYPSYGYGQGGYANGQPQVLQCASNDGRQNYCAAQIRQGVELLRQTSRSACVQGQSWGWDRGGVWVAGGCRGEFRVW